MKNLIIPITIKFPTPKKIDYTKYIQPQKQVFIKHKSGANIAILE